MGKAVIPVIQDEPLNPEAEGENEAEMVSTPLQDESAEDIMSNLGL